MTFNTIAALFLQLQLQLLILLLYIDTTQGQDDSCVSLGNSKVCSAFSQFYVALPSLGNDYPFLLNTTTIEEFDQRLLQYVNSTSNYLFPLGCLSTNYNPTIPYARYSLTRLCAAMIQDPAYSLPCNFNSQLTPPPLCQQTCFGWVDSVRQITSNPRVCVASAQRNDTLISFNDQCSTWEGFNGTAADNCISGIANEPLNCGFGTGNANIACQYCKQYSSTDTCCQNVTGCSTPLSPSAIAGIVIGSIIAAALLIFACLFLYFKRNNEKRQNPFHFMSSSSAVVSSSSNSKEECGGTMADEEVNITNSSNNKIQINSNQDDSIIPSTTQTPINNNEELFVVIHPYPPQVADELELNPGDLVCLAFHFDDGWALGFNVTTNKKGAFPTVCVIPAPEESLDQLLNQQQQQQPIVEIDTPTKKKRSLSLNTSHHKQQQQQQNSNNIPKRSASYKSNYDYIEAESPSSPTFHTPFFTSTTSNNSNTNTTANNNHITSHHQLLPRINSNRNDHYEMS